MSIQPGTGYGFSTSNGLSTINVNQPWVEYNVGTDHKEQFEISVNKVSGGNYLISVLNGSCVFTQLDGTDQKIIYQYQASNSAATKVVGTNSSYINNTAGASVSGPGGHIVVGAGKWAVHIIQVTNQDDDIPPVIVFVPYASADWSTVLPIDVPNGLIPAFDAYTDPCYQLMNVGIIEWVTDKFVINQKLIGSLTMPEPIKTGQTMPTPDEVPYTPSLYQCRAGYLIDEGEPTKRILQIGNGSCGYTDSNMPLIKTGALTNYWQANHTVANLYPTSTQNAGGDALSPWMMAGGGYDLDAGSYSVFVAKWDIKSDALPSGGGAITAKPALMIVAFADLNTFFVETGPSYYTNTMNVHKMTGYDGLGEGGTDWGNCHTSWYNPMKFGYNVKFIADITVAEQSAPTCTITTLQEHSATANRILKLEFSDLNSSGTITFKYDDVESGNFDPFQESARQLSNALQQIDALKKNIIVSSGSDLIFYVEFINNLQLRSTFDIEVGTNELLPLKKIDITQYASGFIDLSIDLQFNGTQLMNEKDWTEADDYYNYNLDNNWVDVVNRADAIAYAVPGGYTLNSTIDGIIDDTTPTAYVAAGFKDFYFRDGSCAKQLPDYTIPPFTVYQGPSGAGYWTVQPGTLNDYVPDNMESEITASSGMIYLQISNTDGAYPGDTLTIETAASTPADTDEYGYITLAEITSATTVNQFVTGSLWSQRHKFTSPGSASYFFYRV